MTDHPTEAGHNDRCLLVDCGQQWPDMPADVHDALLRLEDDIEAVTETLTTCEASSELDAEDFERFVVAHRWRNPVGVFDFARQTCQLMELLHNARRGAASSVGSELYAEEIRRTVDNDPAALQQIRDLLDRVLGEATTPAPVASTGVVDELRVRRLVVVAEDGFERVVLEDAGTHGGLTVNSREAGKYGSVYAAMSATEEATGGDASVYVSAGGGICTGLTVDLVDESRSLFRGSVFVDDSEGDGGMSFDRYGVRMEAGRVEAERRRVNEKTLL
jgi:hypothetical protein